MRRRKDSGGSSSKRGGYKLISLVRASSIVRIRIIANFDSRYAGKKKKVNR